MGMPQSSRWLSHRKLGSVIGRCAAPPVEVPRGLPVDPVEPCHGPALGIEPGSHGLMGVGPVETVGKSVLPGPYHLDRGIHLHGHLHREFGVVGVQARPNPPPASMEL